VTSSFQWSLGFEHGRLFCLVVLAMTMIMIWGFCVQRGRGMMVWSWKVFYEREEVGYPLQLLDQLCEEI
jgi:hypothetical protein